jgi:hypothetical protein
MPGAAFRLSVDVLLDDELHLFMFDFVRMSVSERVGEKRERERVRKSGREKRRESRE